VLRSRALGSKQDNGKEEKEDEEWEVATGVMSKTDGLVQIDSNIYCADTLDGGASDWIKTQNGEPVSSYPASRKPNDKNDDLPIPKGTSNSQTPLKASCHCSTVRFTISRPNATSKDLWSPLSDLIIPFHTGDPQIKNPDNVPWWLRDHDTKYLAGTCACRSCRLISGFEIQTWAFVPRVNISIVVPEGNGSKTGSAEVPLDFTTLPPGVLKSYRSSPGVVREFCGTCGATAFWHDEERPDLVDVSVGLLEADEGARAEGWLDWWTGRVSFEEEPEIDRPSGDGRGGTFDLIPGLQSGLEEWARSR